jgi:predicted Zn-ribbon and HTH transcriptional regulator
MTRREEIIKLLMEKELSIQEIANLYRTDSRDILDDFEHIKKSIKPRKIVSRAAYCKKCGFVFKERSRISTPSKCPRCKSEWIAPKMFKIK